MKLKLLGVIAALSLTGCNKLFLYGLSAKHPSFNPGKPLIIIMAGQSNMAGGYNETRVIPNTPRIKYVGPAGSGPVEPFAEDLSARNPNLNLIIVSCAVSGTYLSQWMPGGLIEPCITAAKAELSNGVMGGFVFLQGEADAKEDGALTYDWAQSFTSLARYVRTSLGQNSPVVLARISHTTLPRFPLWDHIRAEQDSVMMPNLAHVSTDGVGLVDGIHYDMAGYYLVGKRMADAFYGLLTESN